LDERRAAEVADLAREGRLEARHAAAALHRLEHRRLLAADVRAGANDEIDREAFEEAGEAELVDRLRQASARRRVLLP
jgi:hypothetical protein